MSIYQNAAVVTYTACGLSVTADLGDLVTIVTELAIWSIYEPSPQKVNLPPKYSLITPLQPLDRTGDFGELVAIVAAFATQNVDDIVTAKGRLTINGRTVGVTYDAARCPYDKLPSQLLSSQFSPLG